MIIPKSRSGLLYIVISYFTISCLYIIFSDRFLLYLFQNDSSSTLFHEIQSYKGIGFVLLTVVILFVVLRKSEAINNYFINSLKSNKLKYNNLFNNISHGVVYTTTDGLVIAVNKAYLDLCGVTKEQIIGKAIYSKTGKLVHEDSTPLESHEHPTKIAVQTKKPVLNTTIGVLNPTTNKYTWLKINSIPEFKAGKEDPYRVCTTIDDITLFKNNQDELQSTQKEVKESFSKVALSEFLLKEASGMAKVGVYEINSEKDSMHFSDEMYHIFNIPLEQEYPFEATRKAFKKKSKALLIKVVKECMEKGTPFDVELEIEFAEKPTTWTRVIGKPIYNEQNDIIGRRGIMQDITDIKRSQLELKLSNKKLQTFIELLKTREKSLNEVSKIAKIGYWEYNSVTGVAMWSDYVHHIYGSDPKERAPLQKDIAKIFDKESQKKHEQATIDVTTKGIPYDIEVKMTNLRNEVVWARSVVQPIYNEQNELVGRRGVLQNITDSKKAKIESILSKKELNVSLDLAIESEYSLKEAGRMAKIGYWSYDKQTDAVSWSDAVHQIYGTDPKEGEPELDVILSVFNEESRKQLVEATLDLTNNGVSFDIELQMTNLKNEKCWLRNIGEAIYNDKGEIVGRRGVTQNITEQKLIENNLKRNKSEIKKALIKVERSEFLLNESGSIAKIGAWELVLSSQKILWSDQVFELHAIPVGEVPPLNECVKYYIEGSDEILKKAIEECITEKKKYDLELRLENADNEKFWVNAIGYPVLNEKGQVTSIRGTIQDVTQRVIAKKEIEEYQTSLQKMTTEITLVEEKQKKEIATNIHDHLSQSLIISKMRINELKKKPQLKMIDKDLQFIETHISEALENSRKISFELSPPVLYQLGIVAALNWLLDKVETTHKIECQFNSNITNIKLDDVKSILLFRSIQEVITNAIKYANASLITLNIDKNKHGLYILITDNGDGFDTSLLNNYNNHSGSGFGLFTVQERIRNIQGKFTIESEVNEGTVVKISLT